MEAAGRWSPLLHQTGEEGESVLVHLAPNHIWDSVHVHTSAEIITYLISQQKN